jgi:hypothetical protein
MSSLELPLAQLLLLLSSLPFSSLLCRRPQEKIRSAFTGIWQILLTNKKKRMPPIVFKKEHSHFSIGFVYVK